MTVCQHCGAPLPDNEPDTADSLEITCREKGWQVFPGGRVREAVAADFGV